MINTVILALLPILLLISLGVYLRYSAFLAEAFWPQAERLGYFILLPALFFHGLSMADLTELPVASLALTLILSTVIVSIALLALRPAFSVEGAAFTSIFQGSVRFNNYVGVSLAASILGAQGIALAAICNAAIVPTVNILCVLVFARYGTARLSARGILRQLVLNPLVMSCFAGIAFQVLGVRVPSSIEPALRTLGAASMPLGLICVGAALNFKTARHWTKPILSSSVTKFMIMPLATVAVATIIGLNGPALTIAVMFQALPTASSAYLMARQLGGDAPLMAGITAAQTIIAFAMIPIVLTGAAIVLNQ